ncbi:MAG: hypothetical protein ACI9KE_000533 [Polyangiales bacterium]|jgi:hypothetical protein
MRRLSVLLILLAACGDDSAPTSDAGRGMDAGSDAGGPDAGPGAVPESLELRVAPARSAYFTDQAVRIEGVVRDSAGAMIRSVGFTLETPPQATLADDGTFTLNTEGYVNFEGCTDRPGAEGAEVCDFVRILVDDGTPNLEVSSPVPGEEIGGGTATSILVEGSVADSRDVAVRVNGDPVSLDAMGAFSHEVSALFGVNHLVISASDGISNEARVEMDVLYSDVFRAGSGGTENTLEDAITLRLGQAFFDDRMPTTALEATDLADVLQLVLENADLLSLLPSPLIGSAGLNLSATAVDVEDVSVELDVVDDGLDLFARLGRINISTTGSFTVDGTTLDLSGGLDAELSVYGHVTILKDSVDSPIESSVDSLTVAIESIDGRFASEEANAILALAEGLLRNRIEALLADSVGDTLLSAVPAVLVDGIGALDTSLRDQTFVLDTGVFAPMTLNIDARLSRLDTVYLSHVDAPMNFRASTDQENIHPESRGVADLADGSESVLFDVPAALAARVAVLNGLLHSLWSSGLLQIDATEILPESLAGVVEEATLRGLMTPIIRPARGAETDDFVFTIGQLELDLDLLGEQVTFGVTIEAGMTIDIVEGALVFAVEEEPDVRAWIITSTTPSPSVTTDTLRTLVLTQLWPSLRDSLLPGLSLALPSFALGDLSAIAPDLSGFALNISLASPVQLRRHSLVAELGIRGSL